MRNAGRPLTLSFRALPSPWATSRPNEAVNAHQTTSVGVVGPSDDTPISEPQPQPQLRPHDLAALDESVAVGVAQTTPEAKALDML